jgi:hypothetical protein
MWGGTKKDGSEPGYDFSLYNPDSQPSSNSSATLETLVLSRIALTLASLIVTSEMMTVKACFPLGARGPLVLAGRPGTLFFAT